MVKAEVCKTSIQRFESARRLHHAVAAVVLVLLALSPAVASAGQILQVKSFSGSPAALVYDPFDPVGGTLDEVRVSINGTLSATATTLPHIFPPAFSPVPYPVTMIVDHHWFGLAGRGFTFSNPARVTRVVTANGAGGPVSFAQPYSISFRFDVATDVAGLVPATASGIVPPASVTGRRSNFVKSVNPINEVDVVNPPFLAVPDAVPILPAQSAGMLTLDYRFTPPPPPPSPLVFKTTTTLALPGPLLTTSGSAKYGDIHTGNVTDTSTLSAEVRGSISPGENSLLDQSGARAAAERGGQVRALARAAGQPTTVAVDPTLTASSTATQISQWLVTSDALAPGTLVPVDVLLHVGGTLQASGGDLAGEVSAFVKERLSLFREGAPVELLHEGGGTLDAAAGLVESGGWTFATVPGSPPAAVIDDVIVLQDLFTARVGEIFALELFLQTDAFAKDLNDRFALADFFQDGRGVSFELASDAAAQFALRVPGPAGAFLILPGLALALTLRRHLRRARAPSSGGA